MARQSINIVDEMLAKKRWGNIKSQITRKLAKYENPEEVKITLQVRNKFAQIPYGTQELENKTLDDVFEDFPESVDLEFMIFENGESDGLQGYLKKFEDVNTESYSVAVQESPENKISHIKETNLSLPQNQSPTQTTTQNNQPSIDVNTLVMQISDMNERNMERFASLISTKSNEPKTETKSSDSTKLEENLRQQIADLKIEHEKLVTELRNIIREEKEKANTASSQLFTLQIENTKLAMQASQNVNPQTVDARVEEAMRAFERNQKKMQEQLDEKKKEFDLLNMAVMEKRIQSQLKNNPENSELDKAVADVFRSKVPTIIDRGIDLMTSIPRNGKDITPTPII